MLTSGRHDVYYEWQVLDVFWSRLTQDGFNGGRVWGRRNQADSGGAERLIYVQNRSDLAGEAWSIDVCHEPSSHTGASPATKAR